MSHRILVFALSLAAVASCAVGTVDPIDSSRPGPDTIEMDIVVLDPDVSADVRAPDDIRMTPDIPDAPTPDIPDTRDVLPPAPTCTSLIMPSSGSLTTMFTGTLTSSGASTCTYALDGRPAIPIMCNGTTTFRGSDVGAGMHAIRVTASGSGGTGTCTSTFEVLALPTCTVTVMPMSGNAMTIFTVMLASTGATSCAYSFDGRTPVATPCASMTSILGSALGVGMHTVVITATGAGGMGTCSGTCTVTP